jgi:DNA ligase-1
MQLAELVAACERTSSTSGRLGKIAVLASVLVRLSPTEIALAIGFLSGEPRQGRLGIGPAVILEARQVDASARASLSLLDVDAAFDTLKRTSGAGSARARGRVLRELFGQATPDEQDFLARLLFGELRQGAVEGVLTDAVAKAARVPPAAVRRAAMFAGDLAPVAAAALAGGEPALSGFALQLMRPVQPMLADSADDVDAALEELGGDAALELKLDGARIQVHKAEDVVRVFSRQLREVTPAVPEVVELVRAVPARELVLDGEVIALRPDGLPEPFQVTMSRFGRRLDVERLRASLPLTPYFFDLVYLDGSPLLDESQERRFRSLAGLVDPAIVVPHLVRPTAPQAEAFYDEAIRRGHEGVMAKSTTAPYAAGRRGSAWLKVKAAHTLDLVVLAAEWGSGRRQGWLSNLHLGARDSERGGFVMLGKTFKGLTDEMLRWQTEQFLAHEIGRDDYIVHVRPELVVEVAFSDVQRSPRYPGGLALRLARVKRYRMDKTADTADTFASVQAIYRRATGQEPPVR